MTKSGPLPSSYAQDGEPIREGPIFVAPSDRHLLLTEKSLRLSHAHRENHTRPAIDPMFHSAALNHGSRVVSTVLTGYHCPECRSALYEISDQRVLRFRCRSGHAFAAESLPSCQSEAREAQLSAIFGALLEEASVSKRMQLLLTGAAEAQPAQRLGGRVRLLAHEAGQLQDWLRDTHGWGRWR